MHEYLFLLKEETKKIFKSKYFLIYFLVILLDIVAFISEYSDRSRSSLYSTGVHVSGQGINYLISHEYGSFGVFVLFLLPLVFTAAPMFADEYDNRMIDLIKVTVNGRMKDTVVKTIIVLIIHLVWTIMISLVSVVLSFILFDKGVIMIKGNLLQILSFIINIWLGSFFMSSLFLLISSCLRSTIRALTMGIATIILPMFVESEKLWVQLFPVFGMQAECLMKRSVRENSLIFLFYTFAGVALLVGNIYYNKMV